MPLYSLTIPFSHLETRLPFSYQQNKVDGKTVSYTFYFKNCISYKIVSPKIQIAVDGFNDIIEGKVWAGTTFEKYALEDVFTYLMFDGNLYKIGKSENPQKRLKAIQTGNPKCVLLSYSKFVPEKLLHEIFQHKHHDKEWFALESADRGFIEAVMSLRNYEQVKHVLRMCANRIKKNQQPRSELMNKAILSTIIGFGKFKGRTINAMNKPDELNYLRWLKKTMGEDKQRSKTQLYKAVCLKVA